MEEFALNLQAPKPGFTLSQLENRYSGTDTYLHRDAPTDSNRVYDTPDTIVRPTVNEDQPSTSDCKAMIHGKGDFAEECDLVLAAFTLMENLEDDATIDVDDGLALLDYPGVIAQVGARILYVRTGRDGLGWGTAGENGLPFCADKSDWLAYLGRSM